MKREYLKSLGLEDSVIEKIMTEHGKSVTELKATQLDLEGQLNAHKKQVAERDNELETLKKSLSDYESLKEQINKLESDAKTSSETYEAKIKELSIDKGVTVALMNAKARNLVAARSLLDLTKAELDSEGNIKGLDKQIEKIKESDAYLFHSDVPVTISGTNPGQSTGNPSGSSVKQMTYTQMAEYASKNGGQLPKF